MLIFVFATLFPTLTVAIVRGVERRHPGHGLAYRTLCGVNVAASFSMFLLILCEILQCGNDEDRSWLWRVVTAMMLVLLALVDPAVQIYRLVAAKFPRSLRLLALPLYLMHLTLFRIMSVQLPIERYSKTPEVAPTQWFNLRQDSLACVSFIGITLMAVLCGISSVSAPYAAFFMESGQYTQVDVERLKSSLEGIEDMMRAKELETSRLRLDIARENRQDPSLSRSNSSFSLSRLVNFVRKPDTKENQLRSLLVESNALVSLKHEIEADLTHVQQRIAQEAYFKTPRGRVHRLVFAVFALYCVYRVVNSYIRMGWWFFKNEKHEGGPKDAIVLLIAETINQVLPDVGVPGWSKIIGVFMSGAVLAAALNGVLRMCFRLMLLLHKPQNAKAATHLDLLLVGQVVGVYVLSIATTLRFNLPRNMSGAIMSALVSPLNVVSVQLWNDMCLSLTSTATLVVIILMNKLGKEDIYDEEEKIAP